MADTRALIHGAPLSFTYTSVVWWTCLEFSLGVLGWSYQRWLLCTFYTGHRWIQLYFGKIDNSALQKIESEWVLKPESCLLLQFYGYNTD